MSDSYYANRPQPYFRAAWRLIREQFAKPDEQSNVVMFHVGRSGSTVIGDLMVQHPDIHWDHEILLKKNFQRYIPLLPFLRPYIVAEPARVVHWRKLIAEGQNFGFDVIRHQVEYFQMDIPTFVDKIEPLGMKHFIILERKNSLRIITSQYRAIKQGQWHVRNGNQARKNEPFQLPIEDVFGYGRSLLENLEYFSSFASDTLEALQGKPLLHLVYEEDIAQNPLIAYEQICDFLGLRHFAVNIRHRKLNPQTLRDTITNFDEVAAVLQGTEFAWMVEE